MNLTGRQNLILLLARLFIVICCFPVHECAHAWAAWKLGDSTGKRQDRITLNPLKHLDLWGTITIFLFGVGYAKPVPVNMYNFKNRKRDFALTALAGPLSNLVMAVLFLAIAQILSAAHGNIIGVLYQLLSYAAYINISLAIFNLIPIPPLDGSRVVTAIFPDKVYDALLRYEKYSMYILLGILLLFNIIGVPPILALSSFVFCGIRAMLSFVF